jgi:hypothetical protein
MIIHIASLRILIENINRIRMLVPIETYIESLYCFSEQLAILQRTATTAEVLQYSVVPKPLNV